MQHSIERKTLLTFCTSVALVALISWAALQASPRAASMSGIADRVQDCLAWLQQARHALTRAELADQAYRMTGDSRLASLQAVALAEVGTSLARHDDLVDAAPDRLPADRIPGIESLRTADFPAIKQLIDSRNADDTDYLRQAAVAWEQKTVRYNATILMVCGISLITMMAALCVALLREVAARRARETAQAVAQEHLANVMDTLPSAFLLVDSLLTVTYANREAGRLLGRVNEALLGRSLLAVSSPALQSTLQEQCAEALRTQVPRHFELHDAASDRWLTVEASPSPYGLSVYLRDITISKHALETQERLLALLEATPDVVGIQDGKGGCYFNRAGREMFGIGPVDRDLTGLRLSEAVVPMDDVPDDIFPIGLEHGIYRAEKTVAAVDRREVQVSQVAIAHHDRTGSVSFISTVLRDISARKQAERDLQEANARLKALATTDGLTGLKNHRAFQEHLAEEYNRSQRYGHPLSAIMLDVDFFKQYNDTFGHPAGDQVLKRVAEIIRSVARSTDILARYGGEEFVVLLPETGEVGALEAAERMRRAIQEAAWDRRPVTVSVGVATTSHAINGTDELVEAADRALYWSKTGGRNQVTHAASLMSRLRTQSDLALVNAR